MKTPNTISFCLIIGSISFCILLNSCSKDVALKQEATTSSSSPVEKTANSYNLVGLNEQLQFSHTYTIRDEKTVYIGQANPKGTNVFIHLDYLDVQKTVTATKDKKHLTMPYGPSTYADSGWAYIIDYDTKTDTITLSPNEIMSSNIVPGSFETRSAVYDKSSNSGTFITRFTALKDNGNETEIGESFFKQ